MFVVGLTGGIGSGKSTFAALLAERGARIIDADLLGRAALRPGTPTWHSVVDQFGDEILAAGTLEIDRRRLAEIVFNDKDKLTALNAIVHPVIVRSIAEELEKLRATDKVVVLDAALIVDLGLQEGVDSLIVVHADEQKRRSRLLAGRDIAADDVDARIASQARPDDLVAKADIVVENNGDLAELARRADEVWQQLEEERR